MSFQHFRNRRTDKNNALLNHNTQPFAISPFEPVEAVLPEEAGHNRLLRLSSPVMSTTTTTTTTSSSPLSSDQGIETWYQTRCRDLSTMFSFLQHENEEDSRQEEEITVIPSKLQDPIIPFISPGALTVPMPDRLGSFSSTSIMSPLISEQASASSSASLASTSFSPVFEKSFIEEITKTSGIDILHDSPTTLPSDDIQSNKANQAMHSCDFCRKRKVKCDRLLPKCTFCFQRGVACTHDDFIRRRGPPTRAHRIEMQEIGFVYDRSKRRWRKMKDNGPIKED